MPRDPLATEVKVGAQHLDVRDRSEFGVFSAVMHDGGSSSDEFGKNLQVLLGKNNEGSPYNFTVMPAMGNTQRLVITDKADTSPSQTPLMVIDFDKKGWDGTTQQAWVPTSIRMAQDPYKATGTSASVDIMTAKDSAGKPMIKGNQRINFVAGMCEHLAFGGSIKEAFNVALNGTDPDAYMDRAEKVGMGAVKLDLAKGTHAFDGDTPRSAAIATAAYQRKAAAPAASR